MKPDGHDAQVMTNCNVTVAQQRMEAVGLPYDRIESLVVLHSTMKNSTGFQAPEIPIDADLDDDVTYAWFAIGYRHAYGKYINGGTFPEWKYKGFLMEEI